MAADGNKNRALCRHPARKTSTGPICTQHPSAPSGRLYLSPLSSLIAAKDLRMVGVLVAWLVADLPAACAMTNYTPTTPSDAGDVIGGGKVVVLEPAKWIGKRFPLLDYIDIGDTLVRMFGSSRSRTRASHSCSSGAHSANGLAVGAIEFKNRKLTDDALRQFGLAPFLKLCVRSRSPFFGRRFWHEYVSDKNWGCHLFISGLAGCAIRSYGQTF